MPAETKMAAYSPRKIRANFIEEYSVWKPATSALSSSTMSKGLRLVSAKAATRKMMKPMGWRKMPQAGIGRVTPSTSSIRPCCTTISLSWRVPKVMRMPMMERPMGIS
ncbi:hypothetical protein D3C87_413580 [compost metagenome]